MTEREILMKKLQSADFALLEANEFLDTHPNDQKAMAFYKKHLDIYNALKNEFVNKFGPISAKDFDCDRKWAWVDNPWPWQLGFEKGE